MTVALFTYLLITSASGRAPLPTSKEHRDVVTTQGVVRGYLTPHPPHYTFLGIPYGRPPTHYDRFKAPRPPLRWDGTFEARHHVKCPQPDGEGEENCLVVNVFTPKQAESLPVLVLVHDGDFQYGWGNFQPPTRFLLGNLVIVTFNYRVGALGFFCLGTRDIPGNAGLKDQVAALYWIQRNIASFGGNPLDVTAYGTGAGAASLQLILLSGLSNGLLHKVILESGSVLSPLSVAYDSASVAMDTAAMLGYEGRDDIDELTKFLRGASAKSLASVKTLLLPCIENDFMNGLLDRDPLDILHVGNYHKVPMLIAYQLNIINIDNGTFDYLPESFEDLLPSNLEFNNTGIKQKVSKIVKEFYFGDRGQGDELIQKYIDYFYDITVEYPVIKAAALYAAKNTLPVYLMKFTYKVTFNSKDQSILSYFYKTDEMSSKDEDTANKLVAMFTNFIKIGDPTPLTSALIPIVWPPVEVNQMVNEVDITRITALVFGNSLSVSDTLTTQQVKFWDHIYKKFYKRHIYSQI